MSRGCIVVLVLLALVAAAVAAPPVREELHWRTIAGKDDPAVFARFLARWPEGRHRAEAATKQEEAAWARVAGDGAEPELRGYLADYPRGRHVGEANARLEELLWKQVAAERTALAFDRYLQAHPQGRFAADARQQRQAVLADDAVFLAAQQKGEQSAYETFLANYPGHTREAEARAVLADMQGRDLFELLAEKKVEARATGAGIESVSLELRRRTAHPIAVRVPVGTYFASHSEYAQSMVTLAESTATLHGEDWQSVSVSVACADMPLDIPDEEVGFSIRRSPAQRELQKLVPVLAAAHADFAVRQAAVWIVTDDATYDDLGTLVQTSSFTPFGGGTRMINAPEATRALQLLVEAGVGVRDKSIWWDREILLEELRESDEGELVEWLRGQR
jgi:hypothetical protein